MESDIRKRVEVGAQEESFETMMAEACELAQMGGEVVALDPFSLDDGQILDEIDTAGVARWNEGVYRYFGVEPLNLQVVEERTETAEEGVSTVPGEIQIKVVATTDHGFLLEVMTFVDGQTRLCLRAVGNQEDENES